MIRVGQRGSGQPWSDGESIRVQHPQQQKHLLASLASSDQQTPIVVVPLENQPHRYVVIDGQKRGAPFSI